MMANPAAKKTSLDRQSITGYFKPCSEQQFLHNLVGILYITIISLALTIISFFVVVVQFLFFLQKRDEILSKEKQKVLDDNKRQVIRQIALRAKVHSDSDSI